MDEFTDTVNKKKFKEAFDLARNDNSFLGRVLTAGMSRLTYGLEDAREASVNMLESILGQGAVEQLLGRHRHARAADRLVGTVFGMIESFRVLAVPGKQAEPAKLAEGISHALVVTLFGIGLSVPAIFFNAFFRNRTVRISMTLATSPTTC